MSRTGINLFDKLKNLGITKSECCQFIASAKPDECQCGLTKREHTQSLVNSEQNWTRDTCTRPGGITDAYGGIRFADKNEISRYIRVYYRTKMDKMITLLFGKSYWHMKPPKLLISVTGGAQVALSELVRDILCKGLVKAASSTDGWITTGGTKTGIMKHVGETVRFTRSKVTLLGIASWTTTSRNEELISCNEDAPVIYRINNEKLRFSKSQYLEPNHTHFILVDDSKYNTFGGEIKFRAKLESEISKIKKIPIILVVVEGGPNTAATVLESLKKSIPCVIIDNSGKMSDLLSYIYRKLEKENKNSAINLDFSKEEEKFRFDDKFRSYIYEKLEDYYKGRNKNFEEITDQIEEIFQPSKRQLLTIFDLNPTKQDSDLDEAILKAFSQSYSKPKKAELSIFIEGKLEDKYLLNTGNQAQNFEIFQELANENIVLSPNGILRGEEKDELLVIEAFKKKKNLIVLDKTSSLCYLLKQLDSPEKTSSYDALKKDISRILEKNNRESVSILEFDQRALQQKSRNFKILSIFLKANPKHKVAELCLSWNRCDIARLALFNDEIPDNMDMYQDLMFNALLNNQVEFVNLLLENGFSLKNFLTYSRFIKLYAQKLSQDSLITKLFRKLLNKDTNIHFDSIDFKSIGQCIQKLVDFLFKHEFTSDDFEKFLSQLSCEDLTIEKLNNPEYHLFIFNILLGRQRLSEIFWIQGENQISNALIASKILNKMASLLEEKYEELTSISKKYEQSAYDALTISNRLNERNTKYLLVRQINHYSDITVLQIANSTKCLKFVSHPVCQKFLEKIWFHKIYPETPGYRIYLSMLFPPLALLIVHFGDNQQTIRKNYVENSKYHYNSKKVEVAQNENHATKVRHFRQIESLSYKKQNVSLENDNQKLKKILDNLQKIRDFLKAPYVKFIYDQFWFLMFLILFSYILLSDFYPITAAGQTSTRLTGSLSILELVLMIWVFTFFCEEIRQFYLNEHQVMQAKLKSFLFDFKNILEICGIFLFLVGMVLRFIPNYACYQSARIILCIDIIFWYIRSLFAYTFIKKMGPMLVMIRKLGNNLAYFFLIILVFFFAFGISTQSLMYPNQNLDSQLLKNIFFPAYFVFVGDYYTLDSMTLADENCVPDADTVCPDYIGSQVSLTIYIFYLLFTNILLQNILIALFNKTYDKIQKESDPLWKHSRYSLVYEYFHKSLIPPPFSLLDYAIILIKLLFSLSLKLFSSKTISSNFFLRAISYLSRIYYPGFYLKKRKEENKKSLIKWERFVIDEMDYELKRERNERKEFKLEQNLAKIEILNTKYHLIVQSQKNAEKLLEATSKKLIEISEIINSKKSGRAKTDPRQKIANNTPVILEVSTPVKKASNTLSPTNTEENTISYSDDFEYQCSQLDTESDLENF